MFAERVERRGVFGRPDRSGAVMRRAGTEGGGPAAIHLGDLPRRTLRRQGWLLVSGQSTSGSPPKPGCRDKRDYCTVVQSKE